MSSRRGSFYDALVGFIVVGAFMVSAMQLAAVSQRRCVRDLERLILQPSAPHGRCGDCDGTGQNLGLSPEPFCGTCKGTGLTDPSRRKAPKLAELARG